jgi:hypothetical protein
MSSCNLLGRSSVVSCSNINGYLRNYQDCLTLDCSVERLKNIFLKKHHTSTRNANRPKKLTQFCAITQPMFVCLFSRVPEGRMTAVSSRSHASCRVWARTHRSHKATRHAARGRQDQFLTMRYNTRLTAAPASPLYGSPVSRNLLLGSSL